MTITKVTVNVLANRQRLRGVASVVFDDCLKVRDILILPKENNGSPVHRDAKQENRRQSLHFAGISGECGVPRCD